ncbi:MAG: cache domain-containing protein [Mangrovibacterium sp.]
MMTDHRKSSGFSVNVTDYIRRIILFSTILITLGMGAVIMFQEYLLFQRISKQQRENHISRQKDFIKELIGMEVDYIAQHKKQFDSRVTAELAENVCYAHNLAEKFYRQYHGQMPDSEIKELIVNAVSALTCSSPFAQVFINEMAGRGVYYPGRPDLTGKDLSMFQDVNGHWVVQKETDLLREEGEGFIFYGSDERKEENGLPQNKVTYVKLFEPFSWYFGSKCYLGDFYDEFKLEIAKKVSSERFRYGGYIFLNEADGTPIVLDGQVYEGSFNFLDGSDSAKMEVFQKEIAAVASSEEGGYLNYHWRRLDGEDPSAKLAFVRYFRECDWIVGAGFYEDDINADLMIQNEELKNGFFQNMLRVFVLLILILGVEMFIFSRFRKNYLADFSHFAHFFKVGKGEYRRIEVEKLHFEEFRNMGTVANEMIDERVKVHAQLVAEQKRALESDRLKTAFLANMSHEIRTPMNAIIGFSELINDDSVDEKDKKKFVRLILQNGEFLMSLINDIIDIAKIESNQLNILKKRFQLNDLLGRVESHYREYISNHAGLDLHFEVENNLPARFSCYTDEFRLKQVLDNLIGNAIKFTAVGSVRLIVHAQADRVYFRVKDTGIGISPEELDSVFERFVQAANQGKRNYGGTGLGLAISRNIVHLLGGEIGVKSKPGEGSEFYFSILC